jgi:VWFA-related protein
MGNLRSAGARGGAALALALTLAVAAVSQDSETPADKGADDDPRDIGLVERAQRGLAQLDVSVSGPWDAISSLTSDDFELVIQGQPIEKLVVDRLCPEPPTSIETEAGERNGDAEQATAEVPVPQRPLSFLFYFDQLMLNGAGRQNAIDLARAMIREKVRDGNRAAIVSSGKRLSTFADLTDDAEVLLEALDRLERSREQWVTYASEEEYRIRDVLQMLEVNGINSACGMARRYQREEAWQADRALRLFSLTLGHLSELDPPKVAFYFADIMRRKAGMHYMTYIGGCSSYGGGGSDAGELSGFGADFALQKVIDEAAAHGTRVYTVRGEGLVAPGTTSMRQGIAAAGVTNYQRYSQAGDSLAGIALETGGRFFVHGEGAGKITKALDADLGCVYLISFDPAGLMQDKPLRVLLRTKRPKFKSYVRGQIVLQSESARKTSKLMAAFAAPGSVRVDAAIQGMIVPTGYEKGRYTALIQVRAPGSPLSEAKWDLGASLLSRGELRSDASGHVSVTQPYVPIVFETEMSFKPGPYELILVAHEMVADQLGTERVEGDWPLRDDGAAIGPIAVIQPADGVFVRDGETRTRGALARASGELLRTDLPTALVGLVCRGPTKKKILSVQRILIGESETLFPDMEIDFGEERCAQIRDLIPASTMTPGSFTYRVRLLDGESEMALAERTFAANHAPPGTAPDTDS